MPESSNKAVHTFCAKGVKVPVFANKGERGMYCTAIAPEKVYKDGD